MKPKNPAVNGMSGKAMVTMIEPNINQRMMGAGNPALLIGRKERNEKMKNNSVKTLPMNQFVCNTSGDIRKNRAKKTKSNIVLTTAKIKMIINNVCISIFCGYAISFFETRSNAIAIIGKSESRFSRSNCFGNIGKKLMNKDAIATE